MSVLVSFHAHPDDEVFSTGGVMRAAADAGHRVVLVTATDGAVGEFPEGILDEGEALADRRRNELEESAKILGVHRLVMFGYADSGMAGTAENANPLAFMNIGVDEAAQQLADVLLEEQADVVTIYDSNGGYGHPDHIQVHHVGRRAAEIAGTAYVYESVVNRDHMQKLIRSNPKWTEEDASIDLSTIGLPDADITTEVDVSEYMTAKRAAMVAHATQIGDFGPFLGMTEDELRAAFGLEWFRRVRGVDGPRERSLPL
ncbi:GlcNAc-PI de-N-acetylase [Williamsia sp. 1138]|uniref:PIG-L family deacetylase n=1 Tax=Williamsia sp. 1138 TaxID=1903117 RepID=UPI000A11AC7D|nr:PIG-L family deacetylase [Williamsia sp. 1138]OZG26232.1 GlcNAc-PI de-N-acetylase [Williamsia sp. 1138]